MPRGTSSRVRTAGAFLSGAVLLVAVWLVSFGSRPANAFVSYACHDDSSIARTNTHGSPNNGTFVPHNGYYYLNISTSGCVTSADGQVHVVGHVTANGEGLRAGHPTCSTTSWGPPCDPSWRAVVDPALANERPAWGFEIWDSSHNLLLACTGYYSGSSSNCPGNPPVVANPGDSTVEFRWDGMTTNTAFRFRIANNYDDVLWEYATFDVVACSACEPGPTSTASTTTTRSSGSTIRTTSRSRRTSSTTTTTDAGVLPCVAAWLCE